jgi:hypothetical protein
MLSRHPGPRRAETSDARTTQTNAGRRKMKEAVLLVTVVLAARASAAEETPTPAQAADPGRHASMVAAAPQGGPTSVAELLPDPRGTLDESRYSGTYLFIGGEAERAAIKVAVDRATEHMFGKGIARSELMKRSEVRPSYTIRLGATGMVSVETPGFPSESSPLDGTEVELRTKYGDQVKNSQQFVSGALLQRGRTDDGSGSTEFRLQPDGNTLLVTRVSRSPRLPTTVEYTLTYRRQEASLTAGATPRAPASRTQ